MGNLDVLVLGEINVDLILRLPANTTPVFGQERLVSDATLSPGSSSVICACGAAQLGLRVGFLGVVGDDVFGRYMIEEMTQRGLDVSTVIVEPAVKTGVTVSLSTRVDRALLTYPGSIAALTPERVDRTLLQRARHLHISSYFLQAGLREGLPRLLTQARAEGMTVSLDTGWDPEEKWNSSLDATVAQADVFLPNGAEARAITGEDDIEAAQERLVEVKRIPLVAIKLGAAGGIARRGKETARAAPPRVQVVDTTGAGDSFNAGFIYGYLEGWSLQRTLEMACVCGALSTREPGGTVGQPTLDQARKVMNDTYPVRNR